MAVYTQLSCEELNGLLAGYDLGHLEAYNGVSSGVENTNYDLKTALGRYILTLFEKRVNTQDLPFFLDLKKHLANKGLPVPQPVPGADGEVLRTIRSRQSAIFTFLDGHETDSITAGECAEVGRMLAKLHIAGTDFPSSRPNSLSVAAWPRMLANCPPDMDSVFPGLRRELELESKWLTENWPDALPTGIIHADLFPDNLLFQDGRVGGVIDFYFACQDFLAYDLAICICAWCFATGNRFDLSHARAMIGAYQSERPLGTNEKTAMHVLLRGCCFRFTLTRLIDYFAPAAATGSTKDPTEFLERLRFFSADHSPELF